MTVDPTKALINREIDARKQRLRGTVLTEPTLVYFDQAGTRFPSWVCDVDIGSNRVLRRVPIKVNSARSRAYARPGLPVYLERDAGRYQILGPADRVAGVGAVVEYDEDAGSSTPAGSDGFTFVREPLIYYRGTTPESIYDPGADAAVRLWLRAYDRTLGLPANITLVSDADGAQCTSIFDRSGHGSSPAQATAAQRPLYRRFSTTGGNSNARSTIDFDGSDDRMPFPGAVSEAVPGAVSIFVLLNKDNAGAGDDVALELSHWRLLSRRAAGDTWGFDQGGGVQNAGSQISTNFTLIELVAASFADVALFQDGAQLASFAGLSGTGLGLVTSTLGGSASLGHHDGRIAEVLVLDGAVSASKRASIEAYFRQTMFVRFSRWNNGTDAFPKVRVLDSNGVEVSL